MGDNGLFRSYLVADVAVTVEEMIKASWNWAAGLFLVLVLLSSY